MNLLLLRLYDSGQETLGQLFYKADKLRYAFTLEDSFNKIKIPGSTRIPAGQYEIKLRKEGRIYDNYCAHKIDAVRKLTNQYGIMHLQNVPNFEYILIHIGNNKTSTEGCLLVADNTNNFSKHDGIISNSTVAYIDLCCAVFPCFDRGEQVFISIIDKDRDIQNQFKV